MKSEIKKAVMLNVGIGAVVGVGTAVVIAGAIYVAAVELPKKEDSQKPTSVLEQTISKSEAQNFGIYASLYVNLDEIRNEFREYQTNLTNYQQHNPDSKVRNVYLAQAKQNLLNVGEGLNNLRQKVDFNEVGTPGLERTIYDAVVSQQGLLHDFGKQIRDVFTPDGISDKQVNVSNFVPVTADHAYAGGLEIHLDALNIMLTKRLNDYRAEGLEVK